MGVFCLILDKFAYWTEDGKIISYNADYAFKAAKDRNLVAVFKKVTKQNVPTGISTNLFTWISLVGLSSVIGSETCI